MSNPLLTLGPFSFVDLESPQQVHLKAKQRLAVHHLGSGLSTTDSLGEDSEIVSFHGIFSGANAPDRIRSIDQLRLQGLPLTLRWGSKALSVIIQDLELDYSSDAWIPYKITYYVVRSAVAGIDLVTDILYASPVTQIDDMLSLLQGTGVNPTSTQIAALLTLAAQSYDTAPTSALNDVQALVDSIDTQLALQTVESATNRATEGVQGLLNQGALGMATIVTCLGLCSALILARNRLTDVVIRAECINQS